MKVFLFEELNDEKVICKIIEKEFFGTKEEGTLKGYRLGHLEPGISCVVKDSLQEVKGSIFTLDVEDVQRLCAYFGETYSLEPVEISTSAGTAMVRDVSAQTFVYKKQPIPVRTPMRKEDFERRLMLFTNTHMDSVDEERSCAILLNTLGITRSVKEYSEKYPYNVRRFKDCSYSFSSLFEKTQNISYSEDDIFEKMAEYYNCSADNVRSVLLKGKILEPMLVDDVNSMITEWYGMQGQRKLEDCLPKEIIPLVEDNVNASTISAITARISNYNYDPYVRWVMFSICMYHMKMPIVKFEFTSAIDAFHGYMNRVYEVYQC